MKIGETIRKIRREREMTQEQLAESLGISISAVSQWEIGKTMPDISMLPALAAIFEVTTDELLGVDRDNVERLVQERTAQAVACQTKQDIEGMLALAKQTYTEYPTNLSAIGMYAWVLQQAGRKGKPEYLELSIRLSKKILERSVNDQQRVSSIFRMCKCYADLGDRENALIYARLLPDNPSMNALNVIQSHDLLPVEERLQTYPKQLDRLYSMITRQCRDIAQAGVSDDNTMALLQAIRDVIEPLLERNESQ